MRLSYESYGSVDAAQTLICFHGHGRSAEDFAYLHEHPLRIISIHLFFHHDSWFETQRIENNPIQFYEFKALFNKLLIQEGIDSFHLHAYSQGGRFALKLIEMMPKKILSLSLMAPDGLNRDTFYNNSSHSKICRLIFRTVANRPQLLKPICNTLKSINLIRPKVYDFLMLYATQEEKLMSAYHSWAGFREIIPTPRLIGQNIKRFEIPFKLIMGNYDEIIRVKQAELFLDKAQLEQHHLAKIDNGHHFFTESAKKKYQTYLLFIK